MVADAHCRRCGGTGRFNADPDGWYCEVCGGSGMAPASARAAGRAGPGNVSFLLSLMFLGSLVAVPIVALVIIADWLYAAAGMIRSLLETFFSPGSVATVPEQRGDPALVAAVVGAGVIVALVAVWIVHGRIAAHVFGRTDLFVAYGCGAVLAVVVLLAVPVVMHSAAIATGADLREAAPDPRFTQWWHFAVVTGLIAVFSRVVTRRRISRAALRRS